MKHIQRSQPVSGKLSSLKFVNSEVDKSIDIGQNGLHTILPYVFRAREVYVVAAQSDHSVICVNGIALLTIKIHKI